MGREIYCGNNIDILRTFPDNYVDSVVTDPPYELGFMGKHWDNTGIAYSIEFWEEVLRVLKPGGHLLSFGGSRTYHRMACAIEDAGFEIRDMVEWVYGQGFPKSLDISKAIDKWAGVTEWKESNPNPAWRKGNGVDATTSTGWAKPQRPPKPIVETDAAKQWEGFGTALKPAHEPICLARKPLGEKSVAENVLKYGTGGLNINGCRVPFQGRADYEESTIKNQHADFNSNDGIRCPTKGIYHGDNRPPENYNPVSGRFPSNLIHDGSDEVVDMFPITNSVGHFNSRVNMKGHTLYEGGFNDFEQDDRTLNDSGSAARFFYCAKASPAERNMGCGGLEEKQIVTFATANGTSGKPSSLSEGRNTKYRNNHPTVKPIALMKYLVTLITPPDGKVLDPFMGSGSTGIACKLLGFDFIGIDKEPEYVKIAEARIEAWEPEKEGTSDQLKLDLNEP